MAASSEFVADLYSEHHGWLKGWLRRKLGCSHQAADIAQDTFIKLLTAPTLDTLQQPRAYLATVANRLMLDWFRRQTVEQRYLELLASLPEQEQPSVEEQALFREALFEVDRMLEGLGPKVREVFILSQFEELPYAEIARRVGISVRSVNNYMARAMAHCCLLLP